MSVAESPARTRLALLERSAPRAAELACDVSLAARVEPELLRAARLAAGLDASAEAELWFSGIVSAAGRLGLVLDRSVADVLRGRLAEDGARLEAARELVERHHAAQPWSIRLEERINYLTARGDDAREVEELLAAAVTEMWAAGARDASASAGIARWLLAAVARLPAAARASGAASAAAVAAGTELDGRVGGLEELDDEQRARWLPWLLDRVEPTVVRVRLLPDDRLVISAAGGDGVPLELPATDPLVVTVASRGPDGERVSAEARLRAGESWSDTVAGPDVEVRTLSGSGLALRRAGIGRVVSLSPDEKRMRELAVGFAVTPAVVVTAAAALGSRTDNLGFALPDGSIIPAAHVDTDAELEAAILHLASPVQDTVPTWPARRGQRWRVAGARLGGVVTEEALRNQTGLGIVADPETDAHPGLVGSPLLLEDPWGGAIGMLVEALPGPLGPSGGGRLTPVLRAVPLDRLMARVRLDSSTEPDRPAEKRRVRPLADLVTLPMPSGDLPVASNVDPSLLGFAGAYRPRDEDDRLRSAIRDADAVIVSGPAGVGKSRSCFEAVRVALPDARFVVPRRGVDILPDLAIHPAIEAEPRDLVIWLDPLEAFVFQRSGLKPAFDSFRLRQPRTLLVATLGEGASESLTDATPEGAAALELMREAMTVEIELTEPFPQEDEDPVQRLEEQARRWRSEENRPFLADTLRQLAVALATRGERERAVEAGGEALNLHRELEASNDVYRDHVADDFLAMAEYIDAHDDAVRYAGEAVERYRSLAEIHPPGRYDERLSRALLAYAGHLEALGAQAESRAAVAEANELSRRAAPAPEDDVR